MLILGIDPGTTTTGYGVLRVDEDDYDVIDFGLIETDKNSYAPKRFQIIYKELQALIDRFTPDIMAIERLFFATNAKTAINVGKACGVMMLAAEHKNTHVIEYAPGQIKKMITGSGRANKKDIQDALRLLLGAKVKSMPNKKTHFDNAADALAIALCHAYWAGGPLPDITSPNYEALMTAGLPRRR